MSSRERPHRIAGRRSWCCVPDVERVLGNLARLPRRAGTIAGPCSGDRTAAFETCRALDASLGRCAALLERVPSGHMDARSAVLHVITLREAVANAVRMLAVRDS